MACAKNGVVEMTVVTTLQNDLVYFGLLVKVVNFDGNLESSGIFVISWSFSNWVTFRVSRPRSERTNNPGYFLTRPVNQG